MRWHFGVHLSAARRWVFIAKLLLLETLDITRILTYINVLQKVLWLSLWIDWNTNVSKNQNRYGKSFSQRRPNLLLHTYVPLFIQHCRIIWTGESRKQRTLTLLLYLVKNSSFWCCTSRSSKVSFHLFSYVVSVSIFFVWSTAFDFLLVTALLHSTEQLDVPMPDERVEE